MTEKTMLDAEYNAALEWAAAWITGAQMDGNGPEVVQFAKNMAMSIRAAKRHTEYRILQKGEIIQAGDELDSCVDAWRDKPVWVPAPVHMIGTPASDPAYVSHAIYRRPTSRGSDSGASPA